MKYIIAIGIFIAGGLTGYFIGNSSSLNEVAVDESPTTEFITQTVHDTIIKTTQINVVEPSDEIDSLIELNDSLIAAQDSLLSLTETDTNDSDISISREVMEKSVWLSVQIIEEIDESEDSLVKEMMGIQESMPTKLLVEFWQSPLNFSGYKLSKSKLVMYGMPSQLTYKLYRNKSKYYFSTENVFYELKETESFLSYSEVNKSVVFND